MGIETPVLEASIATMLDVLAWEMELAAARCMMLDSTIGKMVGSIAEGEREAFTEAIHTVDLLSQQLTSLSAFTRKMSGNVGHETSAVVDGALADITLGALADRMSTALGGQERGINEREEAGDLDLF
ncbi:MAG: hypothetical protein JO303_09630 [Caulobacteraceae bacterium]|nr:hypothetical protein [Caulobacteraceae bacterium]